MIRPSLILGPNICLPQLTSGAIPLGSGVGMVGTAGIGVRRTLVPTINHAGETRGRDMRAGMALGEVPLQALVATVAWTRTRRSRMMVRPLQVEKALQRLEEPH